jgi:hypothetical protein
MLKPMVRIAYRSRLAVFSAVFAAAVAVVAGAASAAPVATPAATCSPHPYAYAGLYSNQPAQGIEAVVTTLAASQVTAGHVAGWIGVGGTNVGPGGQAEWLQAGVNTQAGIGSELYVEITLPGRAPRYVTLASGVVPGTSYHLAVYELPGNEDSWQVLLNGKPAIAPVHLIGSSHFKPMAIGESWNGGTPACNGFAYRFNQVHIRTAGSWHALTDASALSDLGYKVANRTSEGFTALSA